MNPVYYEDGSLSREIEGEKKYDIKVEVGQYREMNKGALKGFFTLLIYPFQQKIFDCRYFHKDGQYWFSLPQREMISKDGTKEYIPLVSFGDKEYFQELKIAVLVALKNAKPVGSNGRKHTRQEDSLSTQASFNQEELPF
jgi:hypothetical protein